jgi:dihydrofolate reductase
MAEIRDPFDKCTKYVLTHSDDPREWQNSQKVSLDDLAQIKESDGPDIIIQGSSTLYPQLMEAGLLDELTLMISPLVLGQGKRLFGNGTPPRKLRMTGHKVSDKGSIIATYEPAGPVEIGTYVTTPPSEREEKRQAAMSEGDF